MRRKPMSWDEAKSVADAPESFSYTERQSAFAFFHKRSDSKNHTKLHRHICIQYAQKIWHSAGDEK